MNLTENGLRIQTIIGCLISVILIGIAGLIIPNAAYTQDEELPIEIVVDIIMSSAQQNIDEGRWEEAINDYENIMNQEVVLPDLMYFGYGKALMEVGNYDKSLANLKKYLVLAGKEGTYYKEAIDLVVKVSRLINRVEYVIRKAEKGMILIRGGCFQAGDTFGDGYENEKPVHEVCVDDFYIGRYEVTVGEFKQFVEETGYRTEVETGDVVYYGLGDEERKDTNIFWYNPGFVQTDNHPVVGVSWKDVRKYTNWLSKESGKNFRLPTEIEWEYAARSGGKGEKWSGISSKTGLEEYAWYESNSELKTNPVGQKKPNGLGIYDMSGNVWEWCNDWYDRNYYEKSPRTNPKGPSKNNPKSFPRGSYRVARGGCYISPLQDVRATNRACNEPDHRYSYIGFRLVMTP